MEHLEGGPGAWDQPPDTARFHKKAQYIKELDRLAGASAGFTIPKCGENSTTG